ncbi:hypothetical protein, partial [Pseudomonas syringae]|uniref:hypothetical protein n=1 Tax=Pseudomonas syringae TaxID=317 RepID=UPI001F253FAC
MIAHNIQPQAYDSENVTCGVYDGSEKLLEGITGGCLQEGKQGKKLTAPACAGTVTAITLGRVPG